jgi:hypothetical protein
MDVGQMTEGTARLKSQSAMNSPRIAKALKLAKAKARDPERLRKIAEARRGKSRPEHVIEAMKAGRTGKPHSKETRQKMSESQSRRVRPKPRRWDRDQDSMLGQELESDVAAGPGVLGPVDDAHAPAAEPPQHPVVGDHQAGHGGTPGGRPGPVTRGRCPTRAARGPISRGAYRRARALAIRFRGVARSALAEKWPDRAGLPVPEWGAYDEWPQSRLPEPDAAPHARSAVSASRAGEPALEVTAGSASAGERSPASGPPRSNAQRVRRLLTRSGPYRNGVPRVRRDDRWCTRPAPRPGDRGAGRNRRPRDPAAVPGEHDAGVGVGPAKCGGPGLVDQPGDEHRATGRGAGRRPGRRGLVALAGVEVRVPAATPRAQPPPAGPAPPPAARAGEPGPPHDPPTASRPRHSAGSMR